MMRQCRRYLLAAPIVAAISAISWVLRQYGPGIPPMLLFVGILISARNGGLGPGLAATLLSTLALNYFFSDPPFTLAASPQEFCDLAAFTIAAVITSKLVADLEEANVRLARLQSDLERHVAERTAELTRANEQLKDEIDARREAEKALARSNEELERFAYVVSHEFQYPLRTVAMSAGEIRGRIRSASPEESERRLAEIEATVKRMDSFASGLLSYSRLSNQRMRAADQVSMEGALQWAIANLRPVIEESGAKITHEPLPTVTGDQAQLAHVFQNLISNAIKYRSDKAPEVNVSAHQNNGFYVFAVRDNGAGIPEEHRERIFQMFTRLHGGAAHPGNGIGLAMCQKIIQKHGGRIWVDSSPGSGSTFYFTIPQP
jgi:light-regulated signal transduction histidine kinase (bacteriophytochrome)